MSGSYGTVRNGAKVKEEIIMVTTGATERIQIKYGINSSVCTMCTYRMNFVVILDRIVNRPSKYTFRAINTLYVCACLNDCNIVNISRL